MSTEDVVIIKALRGAIKAADVTKVRALIGESKERLKLMTAFGTWLHVAAQAGSPAIVECLLSLGADVNAKGGAFGGAAINVAAAFGNLKAVELLLAAGAALDVSEPERNPLFSAIQGGSSKIVKLLIAKGIDVRVKYTGNSMKDMDALGFAEERGESEIANYLAGLVG
ncbi:ankyrin repeat domain-containing protein [Verrucomicrobium sp. BvORR106]|uniref:ankyrin repeat domain-containing protein n=1 Tax=Verrucomicrobium sp. BvORR106 TaxID=1403819 RepID=UPI000570E484|nr:ankyrin repeat domain-containing protein [Verrucomicrobium sp. BvORR106]